MLGGNSSFHESIICDHDNRRKLQPPHSLHSADHQNMLNSVVMLRSVIQMHTDSSKPVN